MTQEVLKLAFEALEDRLSLHKWQKARDAVKEALAQEKALQALHSENKRLGLYKDAYAQPEQEPVAWVQKDVLPLTHIIKAVVRREKDETYTEPLYTTPPQRTWVGLTNEERSQLVTLHHGWNEYGQAIEAQLKQKNGYTEENT